MLGKKQSKLPIALKDVIIVVAGVAIVWLGLRLAFDTDNPFYVVSSGSMEPVLNVNDVLIVRDGGSFGELEIGDIIVFNRPEGQDRVIVHRIVEIIEDEDGNIIRTKGDANPSSIPGTDFPIGADEYIGKVVYVLPGVGLITKVISPPVNYIIIAIILAILFFNKMGKKDSSKKGDAGSSQQPPSSSSPSSSSGPPSSSSSPPSPPSSPSSSDQPPSSSSPPA